MIATDIDQEAGRAAASEIGCRFESLDVRSEADWSRLQRVPPLADVVVNNAGVTAFGAGLSRMIRSTPCLMTGARCTA